MQGLVLLAGCKAPRLDARHIPGWSSQSKSLLFQHSSSELFLARKTTGDRGRKLQSTIRPEPSENVYWQLLSDIVSSSPVGLEGVGGKPLIVSEHNPHVIPIDPLSHSRMNSFDHTGAAQELGRGIQSMR